MRVRHFGRTGLSAFWAHQVLFGLCRSLYGLELRPRHAALGRFAWLAPAVGAKRLSNLLRGAAAHPPSLGAALLLMPLLLVGIAAWCVGFRRGARMRAARANDGAARPVGPVRVYGREG